MEKGVIHQQRTVVAHDQPPVISQPSKRAFDFPATAEAAQLATILSRRLASVFSVRADQLDAARFELSAQRVAVVTQVGDEPFGLAPRPASPTPGHALRSRFSN